jgi:hypothetical protein
MTVLPLAARLFCSINADADLVWMYPNKDYLVITYINGVFLQLIWHFVNIFVFTVPYLSTEGDKKMKQLKRNRVEKRKKKEKKKGRQM